MPKKIDYTLTTESLTQINQAIKNHPDLSVRERAKIIRMLHLGVKPDEIADLFSISPGKVYYWHARWRQLGLDGLSEKPRSGRPKLADESYRKLLAETLETDPTTLGYSFTIWTASQLIAHLALKTEVKVSQRTFFNILEEEGYVYRRPKHILDPLQDEEAKERAIEMIDELKKKLKEPKSNFSLWMKQP